MDTPLVKLEKAIFDEYGISPDYPFGEGDYPVFRHPTNRKWFAIVLTDAPGGYFGRKESVVALNLKCDPLLADGIRDGKKIFPAYHMNKRHWISVPLDESTDVNEIMALVSVSYRLTEPKKRPAGDKEE